MWFWVTALLRYGSRRLIVYLVLYRNQHTQEGHKSPGVRWIHLGDPLGVIYGGFRGPFGGIPWGNPPGGSQGVTFVTFSSGFLTVFWSVFGKTDPG